MTSKVLQEWLRPPSWCPRCSASKSDSRRIRLPARCPPDLVVNMVEDEEMTGYLFSVVMETQTRVVEYVRRRMGTCSVAVNRGMAFTCKLVNFAEYFR